ncbi:hypothetical protein HK098_007000 [Nowakowskiella sp. JEL0407]|nr:hypothetical protein HK098_007000 [Nowakowskiella sp. JEL0407]
MNSVRKASHAGSWYSASKSKLARELSDWLAQVPTSPESGSLASSPLPISNLRGLIAPYISFMSLASLNVLANFILQRHAGYSYSGPSAAFAYRCIDPNQYDRVFILGPSHHVYLDGCAISRCSEYETPLGNLKIDLEVNEELRKTGYFSEMSQETDEDEHSIEMHLPYVYHVMQGKQEPFTVIPILVGSISASKEALYGKILAPYVEDPRNLFIASSDFCHWGSRFSFTYRDRTLPIYKSIEVLDREGMQLIEEMDILGFQYYLKKTKNTICGRHPIAVMLNAFSQTGMDTEMFDVKFVKYAQSSQVMNERESSVSYASAYLAIRTA